MSNRSRTIATLCMVVLCVALSQLWYTTLDWQGEYSHVDLYVYRLMAQEAPGISPEIPAPFAYRILAPWLVGTLFTDINFGFLVCTFCALTIFALLFWYWHEQHSLSQTTAVLVTVLTLFNPFVSGLIYFNHYQLCDVLTYIWILLLFITSNNPTYSKLVWFSVVLCLAVLTRETALIFIPIIFISCFRKYSWKGLLYATAAVLPSLVVFYVVRATIPVQGKEWNLLIAAQDYIPQVTSPVLWFRVLINTFVPMGLLPIFLFSRSFSFFKRNTTYVIFVLGILASVFLAKDTERLFSPAWLIFAIPVGLAIEELLRNKKYTPLIVLSVASVITSLHFLVSTFTLFTNVQYYAICAVASAVVGVVFYVQFRVLDKQAPASYTNV